VPYFSIICNETLKAACERGHVEIVKLLLAACREVEILSEVLSASDYAALLGACVGGLEVVKPVLAAHHEVGSHYQAISADKHAPLRFALFYKHFEVIKLLLLIILIGKQLPFPSYYLLCAK